MTENCTHQKESLKGTLQRFQHIRAAMLTLKDQTYNHIQGLKACNTSEQITPHNLLEKVTTKIGHMFKFLHAELRQPDRKKKNSRKLNNKRNALL